MALGKVLSISAFLEQKGPQPSSTLLLPPVYYLPGQYPSPLCSAALHKLTSQNPDLKTSTFSDYQDLFRTHPGPPAGVLLLSLGCKQDLVHLARLITHLHEKNWHWATHLIVVSGLDQPRILHFLSQRNCVVVSNRLTSPTSLKLRILRQLDLVQLLQATQHLEHILEVLNRKQPSRPLIIDWTQPLHLEDDPWFAPARRFVHLGEKRWTITLLGPSSASGEWVKDGPQIWRWQRKTSSSRKAPTTNPTGWYFRGNKPRYVFHQWKFEGPAPELYYMTQNGMPISKFSVFREDHLEMASNSSHHAPILRPIVRALSILKPKNSETPASPSRFPSMTGQHSDFRPIENSAVWRNLLLEAVDQGSDILIWQKHNKMRLQGKLTQVKTDSEKISLILNEPSSQFLRKNGERLTSENYFATFQNKNGRVFFSSKKIFINFERNELSFYPEKIFFFVQRRATQRISYTDAIPLQLTIPQIPLKIIDFSAQGAAIEVKKEDYERLRMVNLPVASLRLEGYPMEVAVSIRWAKENPAPQTNTLRVGLSFKNLSLEQKESLMLFIFQTAMDANETADTSPLKP